MLFILLLIISAANSSSSQTFGRRFEDIRIGQIAPIEPTKSEEMQIQTFALERPIVPEEYQIGPGDILGINIQTIENITLTLTVGPTGEVLIPSVGIVRVIPMSLKEAIEAISIKIRQTYVNAEVYITLLNVRFFKIQVSGAVPKQGFYTVTPVSRLSDIISVAGGFRQLAREFDIRIRHADGTETAANYNDFLVTGNLSGNPTFIEGDQVFIPYADIDQEGIVIRGAITGSGYDVIEKGETLAHYLARRAAFSTDADLEDVKITRKTDNRQVLMTIYPEKYTTTILQAGDAIDILSERGVSVNGFVQSPGSFKYFPGYSPMDYVNMAGGNTVEGDADRLIIRRLSGEIVSGKDNLVQRGDVIIVPRTKKSIIFGDVSLMQVVVSLASIILTFIAAVK